MRAKLTLTAVLITTVLVTMPWLIDTSEGWRLKRIDRNTLVLKASTARCPCSAHAHEPLPLIFQCLYVTVLVVHLNLNAPEGETERG
jgi:hypothetical protein